jgi:hypothetical protein
MIQIKSYTLNSNLNLTNETFHSYINNFWVGIFNDIKDNTHLM